MKIVLYDSYNSRLNKGDIIGTVMGGFAQFSLRAHGWKLITIDMAKKYRIRKLTPTECFALMGVREAEREILRNSGVSESQQYKMAGNSIVVDVLMGIFSQMFNPQEQEHENQLLFPWW